jgi:hypothetical protein
MSRDLALYFSNKLASEWSASSVTGLLSPAVIEDISTTQKWEALDPLVRVRLLLAPMFLRRQELGDLRSALTTLSKSVVAQDSDEWVRVILAAVGSYDGVLHMDGVIEHSKLVKATLEELKRHGAGADPKIFRPLEEKYLSSAVLETRLPGSTEERKHIPEHSHFVLRDAAKAPGNNQPSSSSAAAGAGAATAAVPVARPSSTAGDGMFKPSKPYTGSMLPRRPPMGPSRPTAPCSSVGGGLFMPTRKPLGGGGSLASRAGGPSSLAGGNRSTLQEKKKAAIIDFSAVAKLNEAAAMEREKKRKEEEKEREAAVLARAETKRLEREAKEEKKKREIARAAAAKEAEKEAEKARKEAEVRAAKEAKDAAKAARDAAKEEAARKKAEEQAEKEAQRAQREAERIEKERLKAARAELKRSAPGSGAGGESGAERPAKVSKKTGNTTGADTAITMDIPSALAAAQQLMDAAVLQPGSNGEAPVVQLMDPQVALAALKAAEEMSQGVYGDFTVLQQQQQQQGGGGGGGGDDDDEEDEEAAMQRYIEMGKASAAAAEMQRKEERRQNNQ